jgi:flagellar basal-body rod protein FlgB
LQGPLPTQPVVREVPGLIERPDGNNVSVERETVLLGQTQLQFRAGVQLLRMELGRLRTAIKEGS